MEDATDTRKETRQETRKKTVMPRSQKIPDPMVNPNPEPLSLVIKKPQHTKRGMGGSGVLEEMDLTEARISHVGWMIIV
jgi:hypothetical protein